MNRYLRLPTFVLLVALHGAVGAQAPAASPTMDARAPGCYRSGQQAYAQGDFVSARQWLRQAAALGHTEAMFELGRLYESGKTGEPDFEQAMALYVQAAQRGHPQAQSEVAAMHGVAGAAGQNDTKQPVLRPDDSDER